MKVFSCIIVDDDEMDRLVVQSYAKRFLNLNVIGVFESAEKALLFLNQNEVDIAFLDIEMPGESGIELRKKALSIPVCVFISSHAESAAETFEIQTLDFIVKPFKFARFEQTIQRIEEFMNIKTKADLYEQTIGGDAIYVKSGTEKVKIRLHEILYFEALKNYTVIVTESERHYVLKGLSEFLSDDLFRSFIRIHRSFAVQKQHIEKIISNEIHLINDKTIPIGRSYKKNLSNLL
ncbi:LytR/AlgR family response regulator transcription factor [Flavobacterium piscinae]|nr:LytTR family DNA-binding domain-containing protein [Flavobacterium piscinae]